MSGRKIIGVTVGTSIRPQAMRDKLNLKDGYTPKKGVDYWTDKDKQEIVEEVLSALPAAEGGKF